MPAGITNNVNYDYDWMNKQFKAHFWHGIDPGADVPAEVTAFIEIVSTDTVKYEVDNGVADDKIIAVLKGDEVYASWTDIDQIPQAMINRLRHYFLTYKNIPGEDTRMVEITNVYGREEAHEVIRRSVLDYHFKFKEENTRPKIISA